MTNSTCLFCRIVRGEIPAAKVAETETMLAFRDIAPKAPVHVLVVPKAHVDSLAHATDAASMGELLMLVARVAREEGIAESGYRTVINTGVNGGQEVGHLHAHILGGRSMTWPAG